MNIDLLACLIEASDVSSFRSIASIFIRSVGYPLSFLSDGSYDGGADFFVHNISGTGIESAFQLSIEKDWRKKLEEDIKKVKTHHKGVSNLFFVSKRRMPLRSFQEINEKLILQFGIATTHYDNQAIATHFIERNLLPRLFEILNIKAPAEADQILVSPKSEAAAALLVFGAESRTFRTELIENLISAELHQDGQQDELLFTTKFLDNHKFEAFQKPDIIRHINRSVQNGKIIRMGNKLVLSPAEATRFEGLRTLANAEYAELRKSADAYLQTTEIKDLTDIKDFLVRNLIDLTASLARRAAPHPFANGQPKVDDIYYSAQGQLTSRVGSEKTKLILTGLAKIVAESEFSKKIAASELFYSVLQTKSQQVIYALGGDKGANLYFDTPVAIPLLCGLLFDSINDHSAYSAKLLIDLLRSHKFTAIVPSPYVEEAAAHLIECCRNYRSPLAAGDDLSFSNNAFASHYSQIRKQINCAVSTFDDYVSVFGSPPAGRYSDLSNDFFYGVRDKIIATMSRLFNRYGVEILKLDDKKYSKLVRKLTTFCTDSASSRSQLLLQHDARVIAYLEGPAVEAGVAKILCTWDSMQLRYNADWDGYCVINPAGVTDLLSIAKSNDENLPVVQLIDYVWLQSETSLKLSSRIWDQIISIEKDGLSDASLLMRVRAFKQHYIANHSSDIEIDETEVSSLWLKWKQTAT